MKKQILLRLNESDFWLLLRAKETYKHKYQSRNTWEQFILLKVLGRKGYIKLKGGI